MMAKMLPKNAPSQSVIVPNQNTKSSNPDPQYSNAPTVFRTDFMVNLFLRPSFRESGNITALPNQKRDHQLLPIFYHSPSFLP